MFFRVDYYAFEQLTYDLVIVFHRTVFYAVQYCIDIIESGFCVFSPLLSVGYVVELLLQAAFFVHEPSCSFLVKGFHCFCEYSVEHFSELCVNLGDPHLQVEAVVIVCAVIAVAAGVADGYGAAGALIAFAAQLVILADVALGAGGAVRILHALRAFKALIAPVGRVA